MSTAVTNTYQDQIGTSQDNTQVVPAGNFIFQSFSAGAQNISGSSSKVELFWDADGSGNNLTLVDAIYTASETYQHSLDNTVLYVSDGTSCVRVRRSVLGGNAAREIYANYQGVAL